MQQESKHSPSYHRQINYFPFSKQTKTLNISQAISDQFNCKLILRTVTRTTSSKLHHMTFKTIKMYCINKTEVTVIASNSYTINSENLLTVNQTKCKIHRVQIFDYLYVHRQYLYIFLVPTYKQPYPVLCETVNMQTSWSIDSDKNLETFLYEHMDSNLVERNKCASLNDTVRPRTRAHNHRILFSSFSQTCKLLFMHLCKYKNIFNNMLIRISYHLIYWELM